MPACAAPDISGFALVLSDRLVSNLGADDGRRDQQHAEQPGRGVAIRVRKADARYIEAQS